MDLKENRLTVVSDDCKNVSGILTGYGTADCCLSAVFDNLIPLIALSTTYDYRVNAMPSTDLK